MAKTRTRISREAETEVLFTADHTCCICREKGKAVQVHHIDENPANNELLNLALMCLECHNKTQISGGFGRQFGAGEVARYRDDWLNRVRSRRDSADELAAEAMARPTPPTLAVTSQSGHEAGDLLTFLMNLPGARAEALRRAQSGWDTGITAEMVRASYDYIDFLGGVLSKLATFYPTGQFDGIDPRHLFSLFTARFFAWHRSVSEPKGPGTRGTIVHNLVCGAVVEDLEGLIKDMVLALSDDLSDFDFKMWMRMWRK